MADMERAKRAVAALREPHYPLANIPNMVRQSIADVIEELLAALPKGEPGWTDEAKALHWIDRYATGIDDEPQMSRILACVGFAAPPAGDER